MKVLHSEVPEHVSRDLEELLKPLEAWSSILIARDGLPLFFAINQASSTLQQHDHDTNTETYFTQAMLVTSLTQVMRELIEIKGQEGAHDRDKDASNATKTDTAANGQHDLTIVLKGLKSLEARTDVDLFIHESTRPQFIVILADKAKTRFPTPEDALEKFKPVLKQLKEILKALETKGLD